MLMLIQDNVLHAVPIVKNVVVLLNAINANLDIIWLLMDLV